ncbi:MAG: radical SAM protein [Thermoprotei archaeon]|jgi:wyosine [tRNA(Phe)-imidazoG37] synthetase (radical SAM superfamily)
MAFFADREILIGKYKHAAYKPCYWFEQSLRTGGRRMCYKSPFGIKSHLCIQSTTYKGCNLQCVFCWRNVEARERSYRFFDEPEEIVNNLIKNQVLIVTESLKKSLENYENMILIVKTLSNFDEPIGVNEISSMITISRTKIKGALVDLTNAGIVKKIDKKYLLDKLISRNLTYDDARAIIEKYVASRDDILRVHKEAMHPKHVAISYDGEPIMYPRIGEVIAEFRKRGISTFLVTNGTFPERIEELWKNGNLPTQLYVTLPAPDPETYMKVTSTVYPRMKSSYAHWERLNKTLEMLGKLPCRTVIRITAVKGVNMINPEGYRKLVLKSNPNFLEIKGFAISGYASRISIRLGVHQPNYNDPTLMKEALMYSPTHEEILDFARQVSNDWQTFPLVSQQSESSEVLMAVNWKDLQKIEIPE